MGGIWSMIIIQLGLMVFIAYGLYMLAYCAEVAHADTYQVCVHVGMHAMAELPCLAIFTFCHK
jgi:hypothetical protein